MVDPENDVVGVTKWRIIRTMVKGASMRHKLRIARATMSRRRVCQHWGCLFSFIFKK